MAKTKNSFSKILWISVYLVIVIFVVAIFAVLSKIFSSQELLIQIMAVVLSVVFTAVVTNTLLTGQSEEEEAKDKSSKVFEKKLSIYQDFLAKLCDVVKDGVITKQEAVELEFATSYLAMHMDSKDVEMLISEIKGIIDSMGPQAVAEGVRSSTPFDSANLFRIVAIFKNDLYKEGTKLDTPEFKNTTTKFNEIIKLYFDQDEQPAPESIVSDNARENMTAIVEEIKKEMGAGWNGEIMNDDPLGFAFDKGNREEMAFFVNCESGYYFQLHVGAPEKVDAVYDGLKYFFGGRRNKYSWWQWLAPEYRDEKEFVRLLESGDKDFKKYLVEQTVDRLQHFESLNK